MTVERGGIGLSWSALGAIVLIVVTLVGWGMTWRGFYAAVETEHLERVAEERAITDWIDQHEKVTLERILELKELERMGNQRQSQIDSIDYRMDAAEARQPQVDAALANITRQLTEQSIKLGIIIDRLGSGTTIEMKGAE